MTHTKQLLKNLKTDFPFIRQMLLDAFKVNSHYYSYPYENLDKIDQGFRRMLWSDYNVPSPSVFLDTQKTQYKILVIKSTMKFYNIIAFVSLEENPDFISIGPFLDEEITLSFLQKMLKEAHVSLEQTHLLKQFYHVLPTVSVNDITVMLRHLLERYLSGYSNVEQEYLNYSEETHKVTINDRTIKEYSDTYAEEYRTLLMNYLDTLQAGDYTLALEHLNKFLTLLQLKNITALSDLRSFMYNMNLHCKVALLRSSVHPSYTLQLYNSYDVMIGTTTNHHKLHDLPAEMTRKYCLLLKNYCYPEYTYQIRSIITYINHNLTEELTLSKIAEHFQKNASFLSGEFSKETGMSITEYIHGKRIDLAIKYLNTTSLSIADISSKVGIDDSGYFTRLFKKKVGMSPREYQKMIFS